jgi:hypothetical protein
MPRPSQTGRDFQDFVATAGKEPIGSCGWQGAVRRGASERRQRADSGRSDGRGLMSQIDPNPTFTLRNPDEALPIQQAPVRWPSRLSSGERRNRRLRRGCG